jgi:hypothetical protein
VIGTSNDKFSILRLENMLIGRARYIPKAQRQEVTKVGAQEGMVWPVRACTALDCTVVLESVTRAGVFAARRNRPRPGPASDGS